MIEYLVGCGLGAIMAWAITTSHYRRTRKKIEMDYLPPFSLKEKTRYVDAAGEPTGPAIVYRCPLCQYGYCNAPKAEQERLKYICVACDGVWYTRPKNYVPDSVNELLRPTEAPR